MDKIYCKILQCDQPTDHTGRVYPRKEVERALEKYQTKIDEGTAYGTFSDPYSRPGELQIDRISHRVVKLEINEKGEVMAEIELLDTPMGTIVKQLVEEKEARDSIRLSPIMTGVLNEGLVVTEPTLLYTSWLSGGPAKD